MNIQKKDVHRLVEILCDAFQIRYLNSIVNINVFNGSRSRTNPDTKIMLFGSDLVNSRNLFYSLKIIAHEFKHYHQLVTNTCKISRNKYGIVNSFFSYNTLEHEAFEYRMTYDFINEIDAETFQHVFCGYIHTLFYSYEEAGREFYNKSFSIIKDSEIPNFLMENRQLNLDTHYNKYKSKWLAIIKRVETDISDWYDIIIAQN